jgi:hypothetical protein
MNKHLFALSMGVLLAIGANAQNNNSSGQNNGQGIVHWKLDGNSANENHFIGTVNEKPLVFKANSLEGIRLLADGSIRLEQLKQQPNENTLGLPRVMVIQEDGTMAILTGEELASKIWFDVPNALECPDNNGDKLVNWRPLKGQPAKLVAYSKCAGDVNVGINTENPLYALDVNGTSHFSQAMKLNTNLNALYKPFFITSNAGEDVFRIMGDGAVWGADLSIGGSFGNENFRVQPNGNAWATKLTVTDAVNFPDYVFKEDYKLLSLIDLENYIKQKGHLPNIPTAQEVENNGLDLAEIIRLQMEKIEELTLYLIELKKEVVYLSKELENIRSDESKH